MGASYTREITVTDGFINEERGIYLFSTLKKHDTNWKHEIMKDLSFYQKPFIWKDM